VSELQSEDPAGREPRSEPRKSKTVRHYLYAVVPVADARTLGTIGIGNNDVFAVTAGPLAAVCSRIDSDRIRPERRNLAAHQAVLNQLAPGSAVLPMSFGTIASSEDAISDILTKSRELFLTQLARVAGKVEMGLRVAWDVPNVFEYFVSHHRELQAARDELVSSGSSNRDELIQVGRMFERVLTAERDRLFKSVSTVLQRSGVVVKRNPARNEKEAINLACLITRELQGQFEEIVCEAAKGFDSSYLFDLSGPWLPHNFVEVTLHL
jgi:hypothetical protein